MNDILNLLLIGSACSVITLASGYFTEKRNRTETVVVFTVSFLWAVNALFWMFEEYGYYTRYPHLLYAHQPFELFLGPLLYCRFMVMLEGRLKFDRLMALLFAPGVLAVLYFIPFYLQGPELKLASVGFAGIRNEYIRSIYLLILYGAAPWAIFSIVLSIVRGSRILSRKGMRLIMQKKVFVAYNLILTAAFVAMYAANLMRWKSMLMAMLVLINCIIILFFYFERSHAEFFLEIWKESRETRYKRSMLRGIETEAVLERIKELMELETLYLDEALSLRTLSEALSITPHQLSEILNTRLHTGFRALINTYRINAAKKMIMEDEPVRMINVAYRCGFNSKNAFNLAFQKQEGMSPTEFKERHKKRSKFINMGDNDGIT
jgi:AraC-like DNA-binding protein